MSLSLTNYGESAYYLTDDELNDDVSVRGFTNVDIFDTLNGPGIQNILKRDPNSQNLIITAFLTLNAKYDILVKEVAKLKRLLEEQARNAHAR